MNILRTILALTLSLCPNKIAHASNLRFSASVNECTVSANAYLAIPGEAPIAEEEYGCIDERGIFLPLHLDKDQEQSLKALAASGKSIYGLSKLDLQGATVNDDGSITMPPGKAISIEARGSVNSLFGRQRARKLAAGSGTGDKYFLVVRVIDKNGQVYQDNAREMSNNVLNSAHTLITMISTWLNNEHVRYFAI